MFLSIHKTTWFPIHCDITIFVRKKFVELWVGETHNQTYGCGLAPSSQTVGSLVRTPGRKWYERSSNLFDKLPIWLTVILPQSLGLI
jgi:hypothetical protein